MDYSIQIDAKYKNNYKPISFLFVPFTLKFILTEFISIFFRFFAQILSHPVNPPNKMPSSPISTLFSSIPMPKLLVIFFSFFLVLSIFGSTSALPTHQKTDSAIGPQHQNGANNFQHFYLENAANFAPIIEKRRSAEFINGLLSLERLNAMGKRSMPPSLLWNMEE